MRITALLLLLLATAHALLLAPNSSCYAQSCASCPLSPFICQQCLDPANCCSKYCSNCSGITCTACQQGYDLVSNLCITNSHCASLSLACTECTDEGVCLKCSDGFYLSNNQCLPCPSTCELCSGGAVCVSCLQGFYLSNNSCLPCSSSCLACQGSPNNCTACAPALTLNTSTCQPCPNNCNNCSLTTTTITCQQCSPKYYLNASTNACQRCPPECSVCTGPNNCQNCTYPGMYYNSTLNMCLLCV